MGGGGRPGDVVAIKLPNRIELRAIALFAAWRLGPPPPRINPGLTETEFGYQLADSGCRRDGHLDTAAGRLVVEPDDLVSPGPTAGSAAEPSDDDDSPADLSPAAPPGSPRVSS